MLGRPRSTVILEYGRFGRSFVVRGVSVGLLGGLRACALVAFETPRHEPSVFAYLNMFSCAALSFSPRRLKRCMPWCIYTACSVKDLFCPKIGACVVAFGHAVFLLADGFYGVAGFLA